MNRTDVHRPSAIVPTDYAFVGFDYYGPEPWVDIIEQKILRDHQAKTGGTYATHDHGGTCMVCGASAFYVAVFHHAKTNEYVVLGDECAAKLEFAVSSVQFDAFRKTARANIEAQAGKRKAFTTLGEYGLLTAWYLWAADFESLPTKPNGSIYWEEMTVRDIVSKLVKYGSISDKQRTFLAGLLVKIAARPALEAKKAEAHDAAADCPNGRVTVEGKVLTIRVDDTPYGTAVKMLVQAASGYKVWGTMPAMLGATKGDTVRFMAACERSSTDSKFGFYKRPTKAVIIRQWVAPSFQVIALGNNA